MCLCVCVFKDTNPTLSNNHVKLILCLLYTVLAEEQNTGMPVKGKGQWKENMHKISQDNFQCFTCNINKIINCVFRLTRHQLLQIV